MASLLQWTVTADSVQQENTSFCKVMRFMSLEVFYQRGGDPQVILPLWEATRGRGKQMYINLILCDIH